MKPLIWFVAGVTLAGVLWFAGCSRDADAAPAGPPRGVRVFEVHIGDRTIPCILYDDTQGAAISCDWNRP